MFKIYDGRNEFYQWDSDQKLIVSDNEVNEVHFCNSTEERSLVCEVYNEGEKRVVNVPNILLQSVWPITAYAHCTCATKVAQTFIVKARSKPDDYVYTETEVKTWAKLEERISALEKGGGTGGTGGGSGGADGEDGADGIGIAKVEQTTTSTEDGGVNVITITKTDGTASTFEVRNGSKGSDGTNGTDGKDGTNGTDGKDGTNGTDGKDGEDGKTPYILSGYWYIDGVSTGVKAEGVDGEDGKTPYILNGYWYVDGVSTGVKAEGVDGKDGEDGTNGTDGKDYVLTDADKQEIADLIDDKGYLTEVPDEYVTETELSNKGYAKASDLATVESIAKGATQAVSYGNYSTMVTALNALPNDTYKVGQNILIVTVDVPDLWVSEIATEYKAYSYVNDSTLTAYLKVYGKVQVGYYVLSQLETQKVDLTDYAKTEDIPTKVSELENDAGYAKTEDIPTKVSELENDVGYAKTTDIVSPDFNENDPTKKSYIANRPFYDDPLFEVECSTNSGHSATVEITLSNGSYQNIYGYLQTEETPETLVGMTAKIRDGSMATDVIISESNLVDKSELGQKYLIGNYIFIYVVYDTSYSPVRVISAFPKTGVYTTFYDDGDPYDVISITNNALGLKKLDNKFLDLANNEVIKSLLARIEALEN